MAEESAMFQARLGVSTSYDFAISTMLTSTIADVVNISWYLDTDVGAEFMALSGENTATGEDEAASMSRMASFLTSLLFNIVVASIFLALFTCFRPRFPWFYSPLKAARASDSSLGTESLSDVIGSTIVLPASCLGYLAWIPEAFNTKQQEVQRCGGEDAVVYFRFHWLALKLFGCMALVTSVALMPAYAQAGPAVALDQLSLTNVADGSGILWLPLIAIYLCSFLGCYLLLAECKHFVQLRHRYMLRHLQGATERSVLLEGLKGDCLREEGFAEFWNGLYPDGIEETVLARGAEPLRAMMDARANAILQLRVARAKVAAGQPRPRHLPLKQMVTTNRAQNGLLVDSIDYYAQQIRDTNEQAQAMLSQDAGQLEVRPAGFVTFKEAKARTLALHAPPSAAMGQAWTVRAAPDPKDMIWTNVGIDSYMRAVRTLLVSIAVFLLIFFYIIPVSFISALTSLTTLSRLLPFLEPLLDATPALRGFLEGVLPTLALTIFLSILPIILQTLAVYKGVVCRSEGKWLHRLLATGTFIHAEADPALVYLHQIAEFDLF
eukprot:g18773.t1